MDITQILVSLIGTAIGGGAVLGFVQFLISRKDKLQEEAKKDHDEEMKKEMRDHLSNVNAKWKEDYCDKNAKAINDLVEEVRIGLADREEMGKKRYDEHHLAIKELSVQHQQEFLELKRAIDKLTENDSKITSSIGKIADKQDLMANGIMGLSHDKLVYMADKISERGAITLKEQATLTSIYEPYISLNGNGDAKAGYKHVMGLRVVSDEEAKKMDEDLKVKHRD